MVNYSNALKIVNNINKIVVGKQSVVELVVIGLLAEGHILLEDVPGIGKTTIANALARSIDCSFSRIQFTPDTLPSDITGMSVYNMKKAEFEFIRGSVMSNIVLADEINRTSPKTQSSLLEAMEERQVTVDLRTYQLKPPFMVIATQNPIDFLGTYNLPEAQLDRFLMKISVGYPKKDDEKKMASNFLSGITKNTITPVVTASEVIAMQNEVKNVNVSNSIVSYIVDIVNATRNNKKVLLGASPRVTLGLIRGAQALAYMNSRSFVIPDDIKKICPYILTHRLILSMDAKLAKVNTENVIDDILHKIPVPVVK